MHKRYHAKDHIGVLNYFFWSVNNHTFQENIKLEPNEPQFPLLHGSNYRKTYLC